MKNKLLMRILATLVAGVSIFSFAGCGSCGDGKGNGDDVAGDNPIIGGDPKPDQHQHSYVWTADSNDETKHNGVCSGEGDCDARNVTEAHEYDNDEDAECNKCHETREIGKDPKPDQHQHSYVWTVDASDETKHNGVCGGEGDCDARNVTEAHEYDDGKDTECNKCPYVRDLSGDSNPEHDPVYNWKDNEDGTHKGTCTVANCDGAHNVAKEAHEYTDDDDATCNKCGYEREIKEPEPPVIVNKELEGAVEIIATSQSELEEAYVTWKIDENAKWYNVYIKASGTDKYTKLDAPLVRKYSTYFRADAVGLAKGTYDFKVVPVLTDGTEAEDKFSGEATRINVKAHQRFGYAFVGGTASGAYNDDGTLRNGAQVFYVTSATAKTVKATVTKKGKPVEAVGFQSILDARESSGDTTPLCFRIVGTVTRNDLDHISSSEEGLQIKSTGNITIEGIGNDGTIKDFGMLLRNSNNVEVRNLGILNCMDDGISIDTDNEHLWMHNNDIFYGMGGSGDKAKGDGALDTKSSSLITHSYNHFWDCGKCNLQGMKSEKPDTRITYHHNWYDHSDSRHPRIRTATVHVFNNYFDGNSKYGVGVTTGASAFVENNYFRSTAMMRPMMSSLQGTDILDGEGTFSGESGGIIKSFGNTYDSPNTRLRPYSATNTVDFDCYEASSRDEKVPSSVKTKSGGTTYNNFDTASDFYKYEVETAEQAKVTVQRYAGRVDGGDLKYEFNNEVEDANYAVIPELKSAITNYKTSVVEIGEGVSGSTGGNTGTDPVDPDPDKPDNPDNPNPVDPPIAGAITSTFADNKASNSAISVLGNTTTKYTITINATGQTLTSGLKMESATAVKFTISEKMKLSLYVDKSGKVKINGTASSSESVNGDNVITVELEAGDYTITKDTSFNLFYLVLAPVS